MAVTIKGLEGLETELNDLQSRIESLDGEIPMQELFTGDFMQDYTEFDAFEEFLQQSEWQIETQDDFEQIPEDEFDRYVDETTGFDSWETMLSVAGREYVMRQLNHS